MNTFLEVMRDMFDPTYWVTVVPVGLAMLTTFWQYDENKAAVRKADLEDG
jgi:hypothetical protein